MHQIEERDERAGGHVCAGTHQNAEQCRSTAIEELWRSHAGEVRRVCERWARSRADVDEAVGRVALLAVRKFPLCHRPLANPRGWLMRLTYNTCIDLYREAHRVSLEPLDDMHETTLSTDRGGSPEQQSLSREQLTGLLGAIESLPCSLRKTLTLAIEGWSYREIAESLSITEANVRKRMQLARRLIAEFAGLRPRRRIRGSGK